MTRGLDLIAALIAAHRFAVNITPRHLGATRDTHHKEAGNNSAIYFLADNVRRATGKPHWQEVAELAQVILGIEVYENSVRHAVRTRANKGGGHGAKKRRVRHP